MHVGPRAACGVARARVLRSPLVAGAWARSRLARARSRWWFATRSINERSAARGSSPSLTRSTSASASRIERASPRSMLRMLCMSLSTVDGAALLHGAAERERCEGGSVGRKYAQARRRQGLRTHAVGGLRLAVCTRRLACGRSVGRPLRLSLPALLPLFILTCKYKMYYGSRNFAACLGTLGGS